MTRPPRKRTEFARDATNALSRRAFVVGAGSAVVAASTRRTAAADPDDEGDGAALTVKATAPYYPTVSDVADAYQWDGTAAVDVNVADGSPAERVAEGAADVFVSGAPHSAVGGAAADSDTALGHVVSVLGWATLAARNDDWHESLHGRGLTERLAGDRPVETWNESDWESVRSLTADAEADAGDQCDGLVSTDADRTSLVRGSRAYQYARGQGGIGYYEVATADVGASARTRRRGDDVVPLIRLGYVTIDQAAVGRDETDAFLGFFRQQTPLTGNFQRHPDLGSTDATV